MTEEHPIVDLTLFAGRNFLGRRKLPNDWLNGVFRHCGDATIVVAKLPRLPHLKRGKWWRSAAYLPCSWGTVVGANIHRIDARAIATFGFLVAGGVSIWSSHFTPDVDFWTVALTRLFMGIGISCFFMPLMTINLSGLEGRQIAAASGLSSHA